MLSAKFRVSWPFGSPGKEAQNRFQKWLPRQPSWISNLSDYIAIFDLQVTLMLPTKFRVNIAFVDLEKAFDRVPWKVIWWALRKLGVEEWIVRLVQGMYANALNRVRVGEVYSEEFEVKVNVHQGSVLSPLLFIIVLEALSREFRSGVP